MPDLISLNRLLQNTKEIVDRYEKISFAKGEHFNVFSILGMETSENATHSAFLGELLNPEGSHKLKTTFLSLFLETFQIDHIDVFSARVKLEHYLGERDDVNKLGGRVDIFIEDKDFNSVCIENKIDASDQNVQIERYCNYNASPNKNKVFYLSRYGGDPHVNSKGDLVAGLDFYNLSYSKDIIAWLSLCVKEVNAFPIIRESINQYIVLIKKLTNQLMDNKMKGEIQDLIISNYSAAKAVQANIKNLEARFTKDFLMEVQQELQKNFKEGWTIKVSDNLEKSWTGLSIIQEDWPKDVYVKLEGQSKVPWNNSIYGVIGSDKVIPRNRLIESLQHIDLLKVGFKSSNNYSYFQTLLYFEDSSKRSILFDKIQKKKLVDEVTEKLSTLCNLCEEPLKKLGENMVKNKAILN